mmetsp:Transcript_39305/g.59061  ORF Transcript_39305/g.59061 Transcript_39305/m.59061 type:complete len:88 (+) Transcript_39305:43-306(+)
MSFFLYKTIYTFPLLPPCIVLVSKNHLGAIIAGDSLGIVGKVDETIDNKAVRFVSSSVERCFCISTKNFTKNTMCSISSTPNDALEV